MEPEDRREGSLEPSATSQQEQRSPGGSPQEKRYRSRSSSPRKDDDKDGMVDTLYVSGLSSRTREADLETRFAKYGKVLSCKIITDPRTGDSRGFSFIKIENLDQHAEEIIYNINNTEVDGRLITVEKARRAEARPSTPGRYLGRSRTYGHPSSRSGYYGDRSYYGGEREYYGYGRTPYGDRYGGGGGGGYSGRSSYRDAPYARRRERSPSYYHYPSSRRSHSPSYDHKSYYYPRDKSPSSSMPSHYHGERRERSPYYNENANSSHSPSFR